jgi:hypothetical protein
MVVLPCTGASRNDSCCIDGVNSPEYFGYTLVCLGHIVFSSKSRNSWQWFWLFMCTILLQHWIDVGCYVLSVTVNDDSTRGRLKGSQFVRLCFWLRKTSGSSVRPFGIRTECLPKASEVVCWIWFEALIYSARSSRTKRSKGMVQSSFAYSKCWHRYANLRVQLGYCIVPDTVVDFRVIRYCLI